MQSIRLRCVIWLVLTLAGCASIVSGPEQKVAVTSEPAGATVRVKDQVIQTPGTLTLKRKDECTVRVSHEGYYDSFIRLQRDTNPWIYGNLWCDWPTTYLASCLASGLTGGYPCLALFGPGSICDRVTGAGYRLLPKKLAVTLDERPSELESAQESSLPEPPLHPHMIKEIALPGQAYSLISGTDSLWVVHGTGEWFRPAVISRIDPQTNQVVETLPNPGPVCIDPESLWFLRHEFFGQCFLCKMDLRTRQVTATASLPRGTLGKNIAFGEGAVWVWDLQPNLQTMELLKIDPQSTQVVSRFPLGAALCPVSKAGHIGGPTITAGLGSVWITWGSTLVRINPQNGEVAATIPLDHEPSAAAVGEGALWLFSCRHPGTEDRPEYVTRVDPGTNHTGRPTPYPGKALGQAVGLGAVWVINGDDGALQWIDARTGEVTLNPMPLEGNGCYDSPHGPFIAVHHGDVWVVKGNSLLRIARD